MNIRRERLHQCGLTNLDYRTKGDIDNIDRYHPSLKYADFGTMGKSQYKRLHSMVDPKEQLKVTSGWKTMSNITTTPQALYNPAKYDTTQDFYQSKGKKFKQPAQIGKRKETELEQPYWTDNVFTGDNVAANAYLSKQVRERNETYGTDSKKHKDHDQTLKSGSLPVQTGKSSASQKELGLKNYREHLNADADQETQLVHLKNTVTNDGQVDLAKVQDIIRALRRRYSTRSNVMHIFKDWDARGKGYLHGEDIQTMLDKMGLKVNKDEAQMMLIAIDENGDKKVSLNEFLDLVFTHNDALSSLDMSKMQTVVGLNELSVVD